MELRKGKALGRGWREEKRVGMGSSRAGQSAWGMEYTSDMGREVMGRVQRGVRDKGGEEREKGGARCIA